MKKLPTDRQIRKRLERACDSLWGKIVLTRDNYTCQRCGRIKPNFKIDPHHIIGRVFRSLRWETRNGVALCAIKCHLQWAESDPLDFSKWITERLGEDEIMKLTLRKRNRFKTSVPNLSAMKQELQRELAEVEQRVT